MRRDTSAPGRVLLYANAFLSGAVIMAFEMLGSRYLNPYFGSGIYTWAALISVVLVALMIGYFLGGWLADRRPDARILGLLFVLAAAWLAAAPSASAPVLQALFDAIEDERWASLAAASCLLLAPVALMGAYSPFAIRLLLPSPERAGRVAGAVYGLSTLGSVVGTLVTTFVLIPAIGTQAITWLLALGAAATALSFLTLRATPVAAVLLALVAPAAAQPAFDAGAILARPDGALATIESEYSTIFVRKRGPLIAMDFLRGFRAHNESVSNITDATELPVPYSRVMMAGLAHAARADTALMIGLGGGTMPTYLQRFMPALSLTTVEIDGGVVRAAAQYFGVAPNDRHRIVTQDGRVFLLRNADARFDVIMVDAFRAGFIPFHLLTREFYTLLRGRLAPGGVAVINLHEGTRLFESTLATLRVAFPAVTTYAIEGNAIVVAGVEPVDAAALAARAEARQREFGFRYPLTEMPRWRADHPPRRGTAILTDDFAPAETLNGVGRHNQRR
jgi:predicted membrane-bound spermidine synthase